MSTMVNDEELEELLQAEGPNLPAQLPGGGLTGHRPVVPVQVQRDRREAVSAMLSQGVSRDKIYQVMGAATRPDGAPGFQMTEDGVRALIAEVFQMWSEEDAEDRPNLKAAAIRRIKRNITAAKSKGAWTAVAQLERTLMMIEGTSSPIEVNVNGSLKISTAVAHVLNIQSEDQIRALVEEERALTAGHHVQPVTRSHRAHVVETVGEVVEEVVEDELAEFLDDESE